jgi:hypothetical protein
MTQEDAPHLAEYIQDHEKRFEAKAKTEDPGDSFVLLARVSDGAGGLGEVAANIVSGSFVSVN